MCCSVLQCVVRCGAVSGYDPGTTCVLQCVAVCVAVSCIVLQSRAMIQVQQLLKSQHHTKST